jgi:hypothetical protein
MIKIPFLKYLKFPLLLNISFLLTLTFTIFFLIGNLNNSSISAGSGTELDPYEISDCTELQSISSDLSAHYILTNNIDCTESSGWNSGAGFLPIGNSSTPFTGSLNGNSHTVTNLYINRFETSPTTPYVGLFGYIENANIVNLHLTNVQIKGLLYVGALVGYMENSTITGSSASGEIEDLKFDSTTDNVGGLFGRAYSSNISGCHSTVTIDTGINSYNIGGFIGYTDSETVIENSYSTGSVTVGSYAYNIGGFVGWHRGGSTITNSYSTGNVRAGVFDTFSTGETYEVGGFAGGVGRTASTDSGYIYESYSTGNVETVGRPHNDTGGFAGSLQYGSIIEDSYAEGNITIDLGTNSHLGGFIGRIGSTSTNSPQVSRSYATGSISTSQAIDYAVYNFGGFVGTISGGLPIIQESYSDVTITIELGASGYIENVAGFVGNSSATSTTFINISKSYATGDISVTGNDSFNLGGFVGRIVYNINIDQCFSTVDIIGHKNMGGFIGGITLRSTQTLSITNSYSRGNITGLADNSLGGFIGAIGNFGTPPFTSHSSTLSNSYSTGSVTPGTSTGGFIGVDSGVITIGSSYWDTETSLLSTSAGGLGYTTTQLKTEVDLVGWDFDTIWALNENNNDGYPSFTWYSSEVPEVPVSIENLDVSLSARDLSTELDVSTPSTLFKGEDRSIDLFSGSGFDRRILATITTDLTTDRDWSTVTGGFDSILRKSFVHNLIEAPGTGSSFTLYVPKGAEDNKVRVCIGASSLAAVNLTCASGSTLDESNVNVSIIEFESNSYWRITNIAGTGGVSFILEDEGEEPSQPPTEPPSQPPPTPQPIITPSPDPIQCTTDVKLCPDGSYVGRVAPDCEFAPCPADGFMEPIEEEPEPPQETPPVEEEEEEEVIPIFTRIAERGRELITSVVEFIGNIDPAVATTVAVGSFSLVFVNYLISALSTSRDSSLYAIQLISSIFVFGKLKKKKQNYGIVYDSVTKEPINRAIVRITDPSGKLVTTEVTDVYGIFDATLPSGSYKFNVEAKDYRFPSRVIQVSEDEPYMNVYHGKVINHTTEDILNVSIPMDRLDSSLLHDSTTSLKSIFTAIWNISLYVLFLLGFVLAITNVIREPNTILFVILAIYIAFIIIFLVMKIKERKSFGLVRNAYGTLIEGLEIGLLEQEFNTLYAKRVTDDGGKYRFILPGGKYKLVLLNQEYELVDETEDVIEVRDGSVYVFRDDIVVKKK